MKLRRRLFAPSLVLAVSCAIAALAMAGCGWGESEAATRDDVERTPSSAKRRDDRPEAVRLRRLLDEGRAELAAPLVETLADDLGVEGPLLRARLAALRGDHGDWLAEVEAARAVDPRDPRPYATAVELYAAKGRIQSANAELARGLEVVGSTTPELQRARGVLAIVQPGGGRIGLELLEAALRDDPDLPFVGRPMGQAYLLAAKRATADQRLELALERIERSLEFDPLDPDAKRTYAEILIAAQRDFDTGLAILEQLLADGEPLRDLLAQKTWSAGVHAQLAGDEDLALDRYLRARELGAVEVESGIAAAFLERRSDAIFETARTAASDGMEDLVRERLDAAVELSGGGDSARYGFAESFVEAAAGALAGGDLDGAARFARGAELADESVLGLPEVRGALDFQRAIRAMERGEPAIALGYAEEAARAVPGDALVQQLLGELYYAREDYADAVPALDRALRNAELDGEPLGLDVVLLLAQCQHLSGSVDEAIATLEHSLRSSHPGEPERRDEAERYLRVLRGG